MDGIEATLCRQITPEQYALLLGVVSYAHAQMEAAFQNLDKAEGWANAILGDYVEYSPWEDFSDVFHRSFADTPKANLDGFLAFRQITVVDKKATESPIKVDEELRDLYASGKVEKC